MKDNRNDKTIERRCLGKNQIVGSKRRRYLVSVVDARARLAWAEVVDDLKSLSVMFAAIRSINLLNAEYGIRFEAMLTDNGAEVASRGNAAWHPVERLLAELGIKHRRRGPYRPQTNGKAGCRKRPSAGVPRGRRMVCGAWPRIARRRPGASGGRPQNSLDIRSNLR